MQGDVSGLQLAFVVKHHGVDPRDGVVLDHTEENNIVLGGCMEAIVCFFCLKEKRPAASHHFPRFADGLVLVDVGVFGGLLLLDLIHDGVNGKAEAGHARQVADRYVELQRGVPPGVFGAAAALAAHRRLAEQLGAVEEPRPHLDLEADGGVSACFTTGKLYCIWHSLVAGRRIPAHKPDFLCDF